MQGVRRLSAAALWSISFNPLVQELLCTSNSTLYFGASSPTSSVLLQYCIVLFSIFFNPLCSELYVLCTTVVHKDEEYIHYVVFSISLTMAQCTKSRYSAVHEQYALCTLFKHTPQTTMALYTKIMYYVVLCTFEPLQPSARTVCTVYFQAHPSEHQVCTV